MRYELREWADSTHSKYTVKASSNDMKVLEDYLNRPSIPNETWYRLHIVDTRK